MLLSTAITYSSGILIGKARKITDPVKSSRLAKIWVGLSFGSNLAILFFFKYFNFAFYTVSRMLQLFGLHSFQSSFNIILPVGISFYTFQALSYTMDVYRGEIYQENNFFKYALFVSFFPQLVAGPIERSKNLLKQISIKHPFNWDTVQRGLLQMLFGYFQKVVISDNIAVLVNYVYDNYRSFGSIELALATAGFAIQIYCDFGGYSNIAIGAAKVMGFDLMKNFNTPYFSLSISEFWRRWHISLSTWFRDYLYIPLGGNRKGKARKYINLMIVFLCSGLWHGAGWHYIIWGELNGFYQIVGDATKMIRLKINSLLKIDTALFSHRLLKALITFTLINISWIFFRANSVKESVEILVRIATKWDPWVLFDDTIFQLGLDSKRLHMLLTSLAVLLIVDILIYKGISLVEWLQKQGLWFRWGVCLLFLFWILIYGSYGPGYDSSQFIYFQF